MMTCDSIQKLLSAFIDRQLTVPERTAVRLHLADCKNCGEELRSLLEIKQILRVQPQPAVPVDLIPRIEQRTIYSRPYEQGWMAMRWLIPSLAFAVAGAWSLIHFYSTRTPLIHPQALEAHAPQKAALHGDMLAWYSTAPVSTATQ